MLEFYLNQDKNCTVIKKLVKVENNWVVCKYQEKQISIS